MTVLFLWREKLRRTLFQVGNLTILFIICVFLLFPYFLHFMNLKKNIIIYILHTENPLLEQTQTFLSFKTDVKQPFSPFRTRFSSVCSSDANVTMATGKAGNH